MAFVGTLQQKRYQENFLSGAMEGFREDFDSSVEDLSPEQVEALELTRDIVESIFEDIAGVVNNFCTSTKPARDFGKDDR